MRRITRQQRLAGLRAHLVSKLSAITFIVLILLPFTAPFRSFDLTRTPTHASDALPKEVKDKTGSECALLPAHWSASAPLPETAPVESHRCPDSLDERPLRHVALRI